MTSNTHCELSPSFPSSNTDITNINTDICQGNHIMEKATDISTVVYKVLILYPK